MSWIITGTEKNDPVGIESVSLLLHGDGANGSTTIVDSSPRPKTVATFGNAQISTAQSKFGGASIAFDGNGDYLETPSSIDFAFGAGDFTIEGWCYLVASPSTGYPVLFETTSGSRLFINFRQSRSFAVTTPSAVIATSPSDAPLNEWFYFAVTRASTSFRVFLNGTSGVVGSSNYVFNDSTVTGRIGSFGSGESLNGYINDFRITKGIARYTSNFTPPTALFPDFWSPLVDAMVKLPA